MTEFTLHVEQTPATVLVFMDDVINAVRKEPLLTRFRNK